MKGIEGRVAIITGTASGIGAGLVKSFVESGAKVICTDVQGDGEKLVSGFGNHVVFVKADLRVDADICENCGSRHLEIRAARFSDQLRGDLRRQGRRLNAGRVA